MRASEGVNHRPHGSIRRSEARIHSVHPRPLGGVRGRNVELKTAPKDGPNLFCPNLPSGTGHLSRALSPPRGIAIEHSPPLMLSPILSNLAANGGGVGVAVNVNFP